MARPRGRKAKPAGDDQSIAAIPAAAPATPATEAKGPAAALGPPGAAAPAPDMPPGWRSTPEPDGSVALEVPDGTRITGKLVEDTCPKCNRPRLVDPRETHVCARCRSEKILKPPVKPAKAGATFGAGGFTRK